MHAGQLLSSVRSVNTYVPAGTGAQPKHLCLQLTHASGQIMEMHSANNLLRDTLQRCAQRT